MAWAEDQREKKRSVYVVEAINWTLHDRSTAHLNKYFAFGLTQGLALAVEIELGSIEVAEEVIAIRKATEEESRRYMNCLDESTHS